MDVVERRDRILKSLTAFILGGVTAILFQRQLKNLARQAVKGAVEAKQGLTKLAQEAVEDLQDSAAEAEYKAAKASPAAPTAPH